MTDLDPLLRETMASVRRPIDARPSLSDVRRRARRRNRRRMAVTAGVVACTGVATTALIIRRDSLDTTATGNLGAADDSALPTSTWQPDFSTTTVLGGSTATVDSRMVWAALAAVGIEPADDTAAGVMPTPEQFDCTTTVCRAMFTYVVWNEIARALGWADLGSLQAVNPNIDFSVPPAGGAVLQLGYLPDATTIPGTAYETTTTGLNGERSLVVLIDAGAPAGAMDDARSRLSSAFEVDVVSPVDAPWDHSAVIPVNQPFAYEIGPMLGIGAVSSDPSLLATLSPDAIAAVVIGPDYWDLVGQLPVATVAPTTSTSSTSTTMVG